jgi:hypothetical protein
MSCRKIIPVAAILIAVCVATTGFAGAASPQPSAPASDQPVYGPLAFNRAGAGDFYITQAGKFVRARLVGGAIEFRLKPDSFQIGFNGDQLNLCLGQEPFDEMSRSPRGPLVSCLAGPMSGAREHNSDTLLVYNPVRWGTGNTNFSDETSMKAKPLKGYKSAYQVNKLLFVDDPGTSLRTFLGTLYGYVWVNRNPERTNRDIMPVRLVFE